MTYMEYYRSLRIRGVGHAVAKEMVRERYRLGWSATQSMNFVNTNEFAEKRPKLK